MASVAENITTAFKIRLLREIARRTQDESRYGAEASATGQLPKPIAYAYGQSIVGPQAGAIGASEWWNLGVPVPAQPNILWVLIDAEWTVFGPSSGAAPVNMAMFPIGDAGSNDATIGPARGPFTSVSHITVPAVTRTVATSGNGTTPQQTAMIWDPLDPERTKDGFHLHFVLNVGASGIAQNGYRIDVSRVRLLGYPVAAWHSRELWQDGVRPTGGGRGWEGR